MSRLAKLLNRLGDRLHVGIFGPSLCGKSNVGKWLMLQYWNLFGVRSLVLDPNPLQKWPACALRFYNADKFWPYVWTVRGCCVFADEMSSRKTRRQEALTEYFTRGRQNDHVVHIMGHDPMDLLQEQRAQIQTYFLFDQMPQKAQSMADEWSEPRLLECVGLPQFEFLMCDKYADKATRRHKITHGIFPEFK